MSATVDTAQPKLTDNQLRVLSFSAKRGGWRGGWVWGSRSGTERIFEALTKKGLAAPVGDPRFTPCDYDLSDVGRIRALQAAIAFGDDVSWAGAEDLAKATGEASS